MYKKIFIVCAVLVASISCSNIFSKNNTPTSVLGLTQASEPVIRNNGAIICAKVTGYGLKEATGKDKNCICVSHVSNKEDYFAVGTEFKHKGVSIVAQSYLIIDRACDPTIIDDSSIFSVVPSEEQ